MPEILPDLNEVESQNLVGIFPAKIKSAEVGTSQASNTVVRCIFDVEIEGGKIRERNSSVPVTGKGAFRWAQLLRAVGYTDLAARYEKGEKVPFNTDDLIGQELKVEIGPGQERQDGGVWDEVKKFIKA